MPAALTLQRNSPFVMNPCQWPARLASNEGVIVIVAKFFSPTVHAMLSIVAIAP